MDVASSRLCFVPIHQSRTTLTNVIMLTLPAEIIANIFSYLYEDELICVLAAIS